MYRRVLYLAALVAAVVPGHAETLPTLTLAQAEAMALQNRPRLRAAQAAASAAIAATGTVRSAFFPHLFGSATAAGAAGGSRITAGQLNNPTVFNRFADGLTLTQLITDFGRTSALAASARATAQAAQRDAEATRAAVLLEVHQAYYAVLEAQAVLQVAREDVRARELVARQVTELARNNLKSSLDVSFAQVNLAQARLFLVQAQANLDAAFANLALALGLPRPQRFKLVEPPVPPAPPADVAPLLARALANRPELARARWEQTSASAFARAEHRLWMPSLEAVWSGGMAPIRDALLPIRYSAAGLNLSIPLFDGGLIRAREAVARARARQTEENLQELQNQIARDVQQAWLNCQTTYRRLDLTRQLLQQAQLSLELARQRYTLGLSSIVELAQAQLNLTEAEIEQARARYEFAAATDQLRYQVGDLR